MVVETIYRCVFLDRDGVINKYLENDYVKNIHEFEVLESFVDFWEKHKKYYKFIVITNQSGINKGIVNYRFFVDLSMYLVNRFNLSALYFCPHKEEENCRCRKPKNWMLKKAIERFSVDVENSYFIGDSLVDFLCADSMKIKFILTLTGKTKKEDVEKWIKKPFKIVENLSSLMLPT